MPCGGHTACPDGLSCSVGEKVHSPMRTRCKAAASNTPDSCEHKSNDTMCDHQLYKANSDRLPPYTHKAVSSIENTHILWCSVAALCISYATHSVTAKAATNHITKYHTTLHYCSTITRVAEHKKMSQLVLQQSLPQRQRLSMLKATLIASTEFTSTLPIIIQETVCKAHAMECLCSAIAACQFTLSPLHDHPRHLASGHFIQVDTCHLAR